MCQSGAEVKRTICGHHELDPAEFVLSLRGFLDSVVHKDMQTLLINVFADIACPWCYIGEHRLEQALAARPELQVEWRWQPFQLQPSLPPEGVPWAVFVPAKFGGAARAQAMFEQVATVGAQDGIEFRFDRVASAPNTADAHRVILFANDVGRQRDAARGLFRAYFEQGMNLNDRDVLVEIGRGAGLELEMLRSYLASQAGLDQVRDSQAEAARLGITGVPFYVFDGRFGVSGAQPVDVFVQALDMGTG